MGEPIERGKAGEGSGPSASTADAELVARVRDGDPAAFDRLVRRHLRVAHGVARARLDGNHHDADDVVQEAFITALERIDDCRNPARFRAWLLAIVKNHAHNHRERESVRETEPLDHARDAAADADPTRRAEAEELRAELQRAMEGLTELQRRTFALHDLEGWGHGEIAEALGISRASSRYHLHVARKAIRGELSTYPMAWRDR